MAALAFLAPTRADAALQPPNIDGNTVTITGDAENDPVLITEVAGTIAINGNATTLAANNAARIIVDPGAGNDAVDARDLGPADYGSMLVVAGTGSDTIAGGGAADEIRGDAGGDTLEGGDGVDVILGGADSDFLGGELGADRLFGGDGEDTLFGDEGDDQLTGDKGPDLLAGFDGDDVVVWNNGDASDTAAGSSGFDRLEVNGSAAAGDIFELVKEEGQTLFKRTNLVAFTIDLIDDRQLVLAAEDPVPNGDFEVVSVSSGAGDDSFTVAPDLSGLDVVADGGSGNDTLTGSGEPDQFLGGLGNDLIDPGSGTDLADGGDGDDRLITRDGATDLVHGGLGTDSAQSDSIAVDFVDGVETLDSTPLPVIDQPDIDPSLPSVGRVKVVRKAGRLIAQVPLVCPATEPSGCQTALSIETSKAVRFGRVKAPLVLGAGDARLITGQARTLKVRLAPGTRQLAGRAGLKARIRFSSTDSAGNTDSDVRNVRLRIPRGR